MRNLVFGSGVLWVQNVDMDESLYFHWRSLFLHFGDALSIDIGFQSWKAQKISLHAKMGVYLYFLDTLYIKAVAYCVVLSFQFRGDFFVIRNQFWPCSLKAESGQKWLSSKVQNFIENMFFKILIIDCKRKKKKKIWKKTDFRPFKMTLKNLVWIGGKNGGKLKFSKMRFKNEHIQAFHVYFFIFLSFFGVNT